jgi:hypothetical protein
LSESSENLAGYEIIYIDLLTSHQRIITSGSQTDQYGSILIRVDPEVLSSVTLTQLVFIDFLINKLIKLIILLDR